MIILIVALSIVAYLVVGMVVAGAALRLYPKWCKEEGFDDDVGVAVMVAFWPFAVFAWFALKVIGGVLVRAGRAARRIVDPERRPRIRLR